MMICIAQEIPDSFRKRTGNFRLRALGRRGLRACLAGLALVSFLTGPASAATNTTVVEHGPRDSRMVALTFDACPTSRPDEYDEKVIETLIAKQVPATLFLSGRWVEKNPDKAKYLAAHPQFEIGQHSYYHPHLLQKDDDRIRRELRRTQNIIKKVTGKTPRFFRPPFAEVDDRLTALAGAAGLTVIQYDIASGDPDPGLSPERIERVVLRDARGGSIIVFHMNHNGVHTDEVLPKVIDGLRQKGFVLVTVGELLKK